MLPDHLQKKRQRIQKFEETGDSKYIYQKKLGKACFQHDIAYGAYKDLLRRTVSDKVLFSEAFAIASNLKYDGCQCKLASIIYKNFWQNI